MNQQTRSPLISAPTAFLFTEGYRDVFDISCLPFVREPEDSETDYWNAPVVDPEDDQSMRDAAEFGTRAAAAYILYLQGNGPEGLPLSWIASAMQAKQRQAPTARIAFWSYLSRVMWLGIQHFSPAQIAADFEGVIEEARELDKGDPVFKTRANARETTT